MSVYDFTGRLMPTEKAIEAIEREILAMEECRRKHPESIEYNKHYLENIIEGHKLLLEKLKKEGNG